MAIHDYSMIDLIGNTPLVRLSKLEKKYNLSSPLYAKLERCNPTGSIKDRAAKEMILHALQEGKINQDTLLIEPTSGNTGIGLAAIAATLGMKLVIFMPASASIERVKMMKAFGADCRLVKDGGMSGCIKEAEELHKQYPNSFIPAQFDNENNALAHYKTTGPEIYKQTEGELDIFVTSFGTGGTLTGISRYLKEQNKEIKTIGVEPASSAFVSKGEKGAHKIQGIGAGFKPSILDLNYVDEVLTIQDEEAYQVTRELAQVEGLFVGISAGCNVAAAIKVAKENPNKIIVTVLPDNGERYLSVEGLFE